MTVQLYTSCILNEDNYFSLSRKVSLLIVRADPFVLGVCMCFDKNATSEDVIQRSLSPEELTPEEFNVHISPYPRLQ